MKELHLDPHVEPGFEKKLCLDGDDVPFNGPVILRLLRDQISVFCGKAEAVAETTPASDNRAGLGRWRGPGVTSSLIKNKSF